MGIVAALSASILLCCASYMHTKHHFDYVCGLQLYSYMGYGTWPNYGLFFSWLQCTLCIVTPITRCKHCAYLHLNVVMHEVILCLHEQLFQIHVYNIIIHSLLSVVVLFSTRIVNTPSSTC